MSVEQSPEASAGPTEKAELVPVPVKAPRRRPPFYLSQEQHTPTEEWTLSYADMVTLLLTMFVALLLNADFTKSSPGQGPGPAAGVGRSQAGGDAPAGGAGAGGGLGAGTAGDTGGMRGILENLFNIRIESPYEGEGRSVLDIAGPADELSDVPDDGTLAVIREQDFQRIEARQRALASIRAKLTEAKLDQYVTAGVERDGIRLNIPNSILFATGSSDLQGPGVGVIRALVPIIANGDYVISVEGHTDSAPIQTERYPSNWELSAQRAASVVRVLAETGINPVRLEAVGYADTHPLAGNDTPEGRAQNRRVALFLRL